MLHEEGAIGIQEEIRRCPSERLCDGQDSFFASLDLDERPDWCFVKGNGDVDESASLALRKGAAA